MRALIAVFFVWVICSNPAIAFAVKPTTKSSAALDTYSVFVDDLSDPVNIYRVSGDFYVLENTLPRVDAACRFHQAISRAPKSEGEGTQCDGSQGNDGTIVLVGEIPSADVIKADSGTPPFDRISDNATTFVKGMILFGVIAILYALSKSLGLLDNNRYSNDRNGPDDRPDAPSQ